MVSSLPRTVLQPNEEGKQVNNSLHPFGVKSTSRVSRRCPGGDRKGQGFGGGILEEVIFS